jgi:hypothetical protein
VVKETYDSPRVNPRTIDAVVRLIREDEILGDPTSSWSTVAATEWEARERVEGFVAGGVVKCVRTPSSILAALRDLEQAFYG